MTLLKDELNVLFMMKIEGFFNELFSREKLQEIYQILFQTDTLKIVFKL